MIAGVALRRGPRALDTFLDDKVRKSVVVVWTRIRREECCISANILRSRRTRHACTLYEGEKSTAGLYVV